MNRERRIRDQYEAVEHADAYSAQRWTETRHAQKTHRWEISAVEHLLKRAQKLNAHPLGRILDMPCGFGRFDPLLSRYSQSLIQADLAMAMLQRRVHKPLAMQASLLQIPLADLAVNLCFCMRVLHHFPEADARLKILTELARVSSDFAIVSYYDASAFPHLRDRLRNRKRTLTPVSHATFTAEANAAGFKIVEKRFRRRWLSSQVVALLQKVG
ncbi:MAG: class I SAM-dependent methyltransferase [Planctomycetes bacterium]|nr:class I SAM-dependent methyltransferase [Planctomycetota bacterium]